jgi:hypothetical protein
MKKLVTLLLTLAIALTLNGCGDKKPNSDDSASADNTVKNPYAYGYECEGDVVVNGYTLPPCPDPVKNDETLLGIDTNNNNVRDDVERWLIVKYKNEHKIVTEIGFQTAKAAQIIIQDPSNAKETTKLEEAAQACNAYFEFWAKYNNEPILINHDISTYKHLFNTVQFNTKDRIKAYLDYDRALSGGVYSLPQGSKAYRALCDFDVDKLLGE